MFSGIIQYVGRVHDKKDVESGSLLTIEAASLAPKVQHGSSVAVNGVCLTVARKSRAFVSFDIMEETLLKTTAGLWKKGRKVNLEPALRVGDELGGHWVYGHVDEVGKVVGKRGVGRSIVLTIQPTKRLLKYIVPQGAVVVDGVSLTICDKKKTTFSVSLVSYTQTHTTLGQLVIGDLINIESDMLLKYIDLWLKQSHSRS